MDQNPPQQTDPTTKTSSIDGKPMTESEILSTIDVLYTHLSINILSMQPNETLVPFLLVGDEKSHRADILQTTTNDILTILRKVAALDVKGLDLTWFKKEEQSTLREAFRMGLIKGEKSYNHINYVWNELKDVLEEGLLYPSWYQTPALRSHIEMTPGQNTARQRAAKGLGEYNMGNI